MKTRSTYVQTEHQDGQKSDLNPTAPRNRGGPVKVRFHGVCYSNIDMFGIHRDTGDKRQQPNTVKTINSLRAGKHIPQKGINTKHGLKLIKTDWGLRG